MDRYVCVHVYVYTDIHTRTHTHIHLYIYIYIYWDPHMCIYIYIYIYIHTYLWGHISYCLPELHRSYIGTTCGVPPAIGTILTSARYGVCIRGPPDFPLVHGSTWILGLFQTGRTFQRCIFTMVHGTLSPRPPALTKRRLTLGVPAVRDVLQSVEQGPAAAGLYGRRPMPSMGA